MSEVGDAYPMKTKRKRAAVISAPRDAGDSMPSIANAAMTTTTHDMVQHHGN